MGLITFLGMIGSIAYSYSTAKNELQAISIDNSTQPTLNSNENKKIINNKFHLICKRSNIQIDNSTNNPLDIYQMNKGVEYLKYQGYDTQSIEYFQQLFQKKIQQQEQKNNNNITQYKAKMFKEITQAFHNAVPSDYIQITWRYDSYSKMDPQERMDMIMIDNLWNMIIRDYTYITGYGASSYTEIWNIVIPRQLKTTLDYETLYKNICWQMEIDDGNFM